MESLDEYLSHVGRLSIDKRFVRSGVLELLRNVIEWAPSEGHLSACVEGGELLVTVEDFGVGIYHHLNSDFGYRSPVEAVEAAFKRGVTSSGDGTRGRGLAFCLGLTKDEGAILMETVGASVSGWRGDIRSASSARGRDAGTVVTMRFPIIPL